MIKGVLFDFRGTLVDVHKAQREANSYLLDFLREKGKNLDEPSFDTLLTSCVQQVKEKYHGSVDIHDWTTPILRELLFALAVQLSSADFDLLLKDYNKKFVRATSLYPDARFILKLIKKMGGVSMGVVIDGTSARERAIIRELLIEDFFDVIIISEEVGKNKYSSVPLEKGIAGLKLQPSEILVVGDRIDKDIVHANSLGCVCALLERSSLGRSESIKTQKPTYRITALDNLITLVQWGSND